MKNDSERNVKENIEKKFRKSNCNTENAIVVSKFENDELKKYYYNTEEVREKGLTKTLFEYSNPDLIVILNYQHIKLYDKKRVEGAYEVLRNIEEKNLTNFNFHESYGKLDRTESYYTKTALKKRGWTDKLIEDFLILPDAIRQNFHRLSRNKIKFYLHNRVGSIEESEEFIQFIGKKFGMSLEERRLITNARNFAKREAYKSRLQINRKQLIDDYVLQEIERNKKLKKENLYELKKWKPKIKGYDLTYNELMKLACGSFNELPDYIKYDIEGKPLINETEKEFFDRIILNYVRHHLTDYDKFLSKLNYASNIKIDANEKINKEIIKYYPFLEEACERRINALKSV
ncbi:MAG TPA: hypothetical protein VMZ29_09215 [Candidatus Bathyarchaeia archaeon]|nr:hypothetical protein [Candidatus Bathyarchaeia archaeon]